MQNPKLCYFKPFEFFDHTGSQDSGVVCHDYCSEPPTLAPRSEGVVRSEQETIQAFLTQTAEYFALDSAARPETPELQHPGPWYRDQIEHHGFGLSDNMHLRSIRLRELNLGSAGAD